MKKYLLMLAVAASCALVACSTSENKPAAETTDAVEAVETPCDKACDKVACPDAQECPKTECANAECPNADCPKTECPKGECCPKPECPKGEGCPKAECPTEVATEAAAEVATEAAAEN